MDPLNRRRCAPHVMLVAALALGSAGCRHGASNRLGDYLDEFELDAPLAAVANVSLGKFDVPVPIRAKARDDQNSRPVWLRLSFDLYAEAAPEHEHDVAEAAKNHEGALNDALLTIIRTSSAEELTDPRVAALKIRMTEAARPLLGERLVRQLVLDNLTTRPL